MEVVAYSIMPGIQVYDIVVYVSDGVTEVCTEFIAVEVDDRRCLCIPSHDGCLIQTDGQSELISDKVMRETVHQ